MQVEGSGRAPGDAGSGKKSWEDGAILKTDRDRQEKGNEFYSGHVPFEVLKGIRNLLFRKMSKRQKEAEDVGLLSQGKVCTRRHPQRRDVSPRQAERSRGSLGGVYVPAQAKGGVGSLEMGTCMGNGECGREEKSQGVSDKGSILPILYPRY